MIWSDTMTQLVEKEGCTTVGLPRVPGIFKCRVVVNRWRVVFDAVLGRTTQSQELNVSIQIQRRMVTGYPLALYHKQNSKFTDNKIGRAHV